MSNRQTALQVLGLIDLTSLRGDETAEEIQALCRKGHTPYGDVAAICVYPAHVATAMRELIEIGALNVQVATVVNFPSGNEPVDQVVSQTRQAIDEGADEIDLVLPYQSLMQGDEAHVVAMLNAVQQVCAERAQLKVIIESGELASDALIARACELVIASGAQFIKTSTGKVPVNATPQAAAVMLNAIRASNVAVGFKASGGIRSVDDAGEYMAMAAARMGDEWVTPAHFRFGASGLLDDVLGQLGLQTKQEAAYVY